VRGSQVELAGQTPDLNSIAETLASLVSTASRPTIFTEATLENVTRVQQDDPQGQVVGVRYEFAAELVFDNTKVRYGQ